MNETKDLLMKNYKNIDDTISILDKENPLRVELEKEKRNIINDLVKIESVIAEKEMKEKTLEAEDKREKIRNKITLGTFGVTTAVSIWAVLKTFRFDETGTVTSTLGRGILNNIVPRFKK